MYVLEKIYYYFVLKIKSSKDSYQILFNCLINKIIKNKAFNSYILDCSETQTYKRFWFCTIGGEIVGELIYNDDSFSHVVYSGNEYSNTDACAIFKLLCLQNNSSVKKSRALWYDIPTRYLNTKNSQKSFMLGMSLNPLSIAANEVSIFNSFKIYQPDNQTIEFGLWNLFIEDYPEYKWLESLEPLAVNRFNYINQKNEGSSILDSCETLF